MLRAFIIFLFSVVITYSSYVQSNETIRILIVHSYSQEYPWTKGQHDGFTSSITKAIASPIIKTEYLDTKRISLNQQYIKQYKDFIAKKYSNFSPNIIYVTDDNALSFALVALNKLFPQVPIIFSGVNNYKVITKINPKLITGVFEKKELTPNLSLIKKLFSGFQNLYFVGDNSVTYKAIETELKKEISTLNDINAVFIANNQIDELTSQLKKHKNPLVVLTTLGSIKDKNGKNLKLKQIIKSIAATGVRSIISMEDAYLYNKFVLGGFVTSSFAQGKAAASLVSTYLSGTPISQIKPELTSPNQYIIDDNELIRLNLELPVEIEHIAKFINLRPAFYAKNKIWILGSLFIIAFAFIITITLYTIITRKKNNVDSTPKCNSISHAAFNLVFPKNTA